KSLAWLAASAIAAGAILRGIPMDGRYGRVPPAVDASRATVEIRSDAGGQFRTVVNVNGVDLPMLVDTGATEVVLRAEDAARVGIAPRGEDYTSRMSTANGVVTEAPATLDSVRVAGIARVRVKALVAPPGALRVSLLGMSFLGRLSRATASGGRLELAD
ncbi:MAG: TIGR02281 family clan AA aspartic protease, partial [Hyphomicrobiales bacterium]|nr:TIGR02281 family clan AA aspartic protease [Hyphomicrobiales bacterium]